ncbi:MAG TPA: transcriptional repressor [Actinospica sp.]|nr:transcriptional repressor [Actinospica sp.]
MTTKLTDPTTGDRPPGRRSRQRAEILRALTGHDDFVSAQALHAALRNAGAPIGLTTVYRALSALESTGRLDSIRQQDGTRLFRLRPAPGHRHYLVCRTCKRSEELDARIIEDWAERLATSSGYREMRHTLEIEGVCAECEGGS